MNIIVCSSYLWRDKARVGIHAFCEYLLSKGHRVCWITIPFSFLHFLKPTNILTKLKRMRYSIQPAFFSTKEGNFLINLVSFTPVHPVNLPFLNSYYISRSYLKWSLPSIKNLLKKFKIFPIDFVIFDSGGINIYYPLREICKLHIYRLNDFVSEFPGQVEGRICSEREIIKNVDIILAVSESLYEEAIKIRGNSEGVYFLPNGVDIERFDADWLEPPEYKKIGRPRAIFVGTLSKWFNWELLKKVAKLRPSISFIIIGNGKPPSALPENVYLIGKRPYSSIPPYLIYADVGLILFKNLPRIKRVERPLKFYEYLAAGLPIVSVSYGRLHKMSPYALFANSAKEFADALDEAIRMSADSEERLRRKKEAQKFSWKNIFDKFNAILQKHGIKI